MTSPVHATGTRPTQPDLDVLVVSGWHAGSHRAWAEGLAAHTRHRISVVGLEGRHWRWRLRGGAVTLAGSADRHVAAHGRPDVVLATSMVDLAALRGLARSLAGIPIVLYLHENQITHPRPAGTRPDLDAAWTSWRSALAADRLVFNSHHHRREFLDGAAALLADAPDHDHREHLPGLAERSDVLPPGIVPVSRPATRPGDPPLALWNHRWEHDKNPAPFGHALRTLAAEGVPFEVALAGDAPAVGDGGRDALAADLGARVVHAGPADDATYRDLLGRADVVVSCARHEHFGLSIVEAAAAGAHPLVPARLAYPEVLPATAHDRTLYRGSHDLLRRLRSLLADPAAIGVPGLADDLVARFAWPALAARYDDLLTAVAAGGA